MATEFPIGGVILQAPFGSIREIGQYHFPILPLGWLLKDRYDSKRKAGQIHAPILVLVGQNNDDIVPPKFSIELYNAMPSPKQLEVLADTGHTDLFEPMFTVCFLKEIAKIKAP